MLLLLYYNISNVKEDGTLNDEKFYNNNNNFVGVSTGTLVCISLLNCKHTHTHTPLCVIVFVLYITQIYYAIIAHMGIIFI